MVIERQVIREKKQTDRQTDRQTDISILTINRGRDRGKTEIGKKTDRH